MSSQSFIDKYSYERDQRYNDDKTEKLGIISSHSCIEKYSNEIDHRDNDDETDKKYLKMMKKH